MGSVNTRLLGGAIGRWQGILDLAADLARVPGALVLRIEPHQATVLVSSSNAGSSYAPGETLLLLDGPSPWNRGAPPALLGVAPGPGREACLCLGLPLHQAGGDPRPPQATPTLGGVGAASPARPLEAPSGPHGPELFGAVCFLGTGGELGADARPVLERAREQIQRDLDEGLAQGEVGEEQAPNARIRRVEAEAEALLVQLERSREGLARALEERDRIQDALRDSSERFRLLFDSNPHPMWIHDCETRSLLAVNEAAVQHYGYSHAELRSMSVDDLGASDEVLPRQPDARLGITLFRHRKKDGTCVTMELAEQPFVFAGRSAYMVRAHDVTERELAEDALRRERDFVAAVLDAARILVVILDRSGHIVRMNRACSEAMGYSPEETQGRPIWGFLGPSESLAKSREQFEGICAGRGRTTSESYWVAKDGIHRLLSWSCAVLRDDEGRPEFVVATGLDVTEHRQEEATRARLAAVIEAMPHLVATISPSGHIVTLNGAGRRLLRLDEEEALALSIEEIYAEAARDVIRGEALPGAALEGIWSGEASILSAESEEIPVSQVLLAHRDGRSGVAFFSLIALDQRERLQLEAQLRQSQKMEAVGRLAGGVAHDFNNLLMPILSYAELITMQLKEDDPVRWYADQIAKTAERAAGLPRQLLAFSRRQVLQPERLDLNAVMADIDEMLRRLIGEDIELVCEPDPDLGMAQADRGQIQQVILNLVVNARDAMPQGGRITIRTTNAELDEAYARRHLDAVPGRYVLFSVRDTGQGIAPEVLPRIFEPFFTTKERDKGTGLGLSTVYGIVRQSGGHIEVASEPGAGSTFRVFLPRSDEGAPCAGGPSAPEGLWRGTETILVVEDEGAVRTAVADMLRMSGYEVLVASCGAEALRLCQTHEGAIHMLLSDVVMPSMSGRQLAERLAPQYPGMKVLYMSGHTDDAVLHYGVDGAGHPLLQKPFSLAVLAGKVREVLGAAV